MTSECQFANFFLRRAISEYWFVCLSISHTSDGLSATASDWTTFTVIIWRYIDTGPPANFDISRLIFYPNIYYHVQNVLSCNMNSGPWTPSFSHCWFISEAISISVPIVPTSFTCFFSSSIESIIYAFLISSWELRSHIWISLIVIMMIRWTIKPKIDGVLRCEICYIPLLLVPGWSKYVSLSFYDPVLWLELSLLSMRKLSSTFFLH